MGLINKLSSITQLSSEAVAWLNNNVGEVSVDRGAILLREGAVCDRIYFVVQGLISGSYNVQDKEVCNWFAAENDMGTSYYSFITKSPSYEVIEALEDSVLQCLSHDSINEMYRRFPETERAGRIILEQYYARLEDRLISIQFKAAKERYQLLYAKRPEIILRAPVGKIATYLGVTPETLSRVRAEKMID